MSGSKEVEQMDFETIAGPIAMREWSNAPDYAKETCRAQIMALPGMTDAEFYEQCQSAIYGSALVQAFRGNHEDAHALCSACFTESNRRQIAAGRNPRCCAPQCSIYSRAHNRVVRDEGHKPIIEPCTCDRKD